MYEQEYNAICYIRKCAKRKERKNRRRQRCIAKLLNMAPIVVGALSALWIVLATL